MRSEHKNEPERHTPDGETALEARLEALFGAGRYEEIERLYETSLIGRGVSARINELVRQAYHRQGRALSTRAEGEDGERREALYSQAEFKYTAALMVAPNDKLVALSWKVDLSERAYGKTAAEEVRLFIDAGEKYSAALAARFGERETLLRSAILLQHLAESLSSEEQEVNPLFALSDAKYASALTLEPDRIDALLGWADLLERCSDRTTGGERERLLSRAEEKRHAAAAGSSR